jgi:O-acetyl-ADP-ribose deacetylase (regulator of RNase III)
MPATIVERSVRSNLLDDDATVLVNTVNTVGVMGAGIALAFKQRFPVMFEQYRRECRIGAYRTGTVRTWPFEDPSTDEQRYVLNFPTKAHWKQPSRYEYVEAGLASMTRWVISERPSSIAMPPLGCGLGGLDWSRVRTMIEAAAKTWPDGTELRLYVP